MKNKVILIGLVISISMLFVMQATKEQERKKRITIKNKFLRLGELVKIKEIEFKSLKDENYALIIQQEKLNKQVKQLQNKLDKERQNKDTLVSFQEGLRQKANDLERLEKELKNKEQRIALLKNSFNELEHNYKKLKFKLNQTQTAKTELEKDIIVDKIIERNESRKEEWFPARVLLLNKEFSFAILNLGRKNGLNVGDKFLILRDNQRLGAGYVDKIYKDISIVTFFSPLKNDIKEGDKVRIRIN